MSYDVIVVGGRVAGSATAMLLARRGARVLVVDRLIAGAELVVTEARPHNPPHGSRHCPPAVTWVHVTEAGRTRRLASYYAPRPAPA